MSESVHASWLAGEGGSKEISLYDGCVTDVINSYIQCTKQHGFLSGRYLGTGPDMQTFLKRVTSRKTPSPSVVAHVMQDAVAGTTLQETPILFGDKETIQRKRAHSTFGKNSHRPGFVMESRQRKKRGCPRNLAFGSATKEAMGVEPEICEDMEHEAENDGCCTK